MPEELEPPHPNGAGQPAPRARAHAPWEFVVLVLFVALIGVGIILAWTLVGSKSPERLDRAAASELSSACDDAQSTLKTLPNAFPRTGADRVARIRAEDEVLRAMLLRFAQVHARSSTPAAAVRGWSTDWGRVVDARERYADDLDAIRGTSKKVAFVLPASTSGGIKPITRNMDDYVRENHPNLDACFTQALALETVEGPRDYKTVTG